MKIIKNEFNYIPFYEVDDLKDFSENAEIDDFDELDYKKICFVNEQYDIFIVEFNRNDKIFKYKNNDNIFLMLLKKKYYISSWNGKFMNVLETSPDEYEMEMLDKIRNNDVIYFTTQF